MKVTLKEVSLAYGDIDYLKDINISFDAGLNILLGPTLAGKTSLMRVMAGLEKPNTGQVFYDDEDVTNVAVQKRNIAMVYQQFINYPGLTVFDNIASPLKLQSKSKADIDEKVHWAAELLKLTPMLKRHPLELSGGQQQRCALARAIVKASPLVLLDEPLANLDYKLREELREELPAIFAKTNSVLVYATSEPEEALKLGGQIAVLDEGRVAQFGAALDVYRAPNNVSSAKLFSDPPMNFIKLTIDDNALVLEQKKYPLTQYNNIHNGQYTIGFRPHHLQVEQEPKEPSSSDNTLVLKANVAISELTGSNSFIHLDAKHNNDDYRFVSLMPGLVNPALDSQVKASIHLDNIFIYDADGHLIAKDASGLTSSQSKTL